MRAIHSGFLQMLAVMRRDLMLFAAALAPLLAGLFFRFGVPLLEAALTRWLGTSAVLSPYYKLADLLFSMLPPVLFCFVAAMVALEESDEHTAAYLFITPLGRPGYLAARFGVPAAIAFLATVILLPVFQLTALSPLAILALAANGTLQGVIVALLVLTLSSNKLEGMAVTKLASLILLGAAAPFFIQGNAQYLLAPLPSFWAGKALFENAPLFLLPAFPISFGWIFPLLKRYLRKL